MEYSLVAIQKWEQKYHKPFLDPRTKKDYAEHMYFLECMTMSKGIDPVVYRMIPRTELKRLKEYIEDPMTATTIKSVDRNRDYEIKTADL